MYELKSWSDFSENYELDVFSMTSIPERRKQILDKIIPGLTLNLGCGSVPYLNQDLIKQGNKVIASDFCKEMLNVSKKRYAHSNLEFVLTDSKKLLFKDNTFDNIISVNSILPEKRKEVKTIVNEVYRTLKKNGKFIAFLPSWDSLIKEIKTFNFKGKIDKKQKRLFDTVGWQCFHDPGTIHNMMGKTEFSYYRFHKVFLDTPKEISEIKRIYGMDTSKFPVYEYLLAGIK